MKKVTVSQIMCITQLSPNSEHPISQPQSTFIRILQQHIVTYTKKQILTVRLLKDYQQLYSRQVELGTVKEVRLIGSLLGIVCGTGQGGQGDRFVVMDLRAGGVEVYQEHFLGINDLVDYQSYFVTASSDLTVRLWEINDEYNPGLKTSKLVKYPFVLKGHKGPIIALQVYDKFLFSGSEDKSMMCWVDKSNWDVYNLKQNVIRILACPLSQQIIVVTKNGIAHFININSVIAKKIQIRGTLNIEKVDIPLNMSQLDQSFVVVKGTNSLKFIQVNLIKQIHQIPMQKQKINSIISMRCKGRLMFYGQLGSGVKLLTI